MESAVQHCPYPTRSDYSPGFEEARPGIVAFSMGTRSVVGERSLYRGKDDQCEVGDRKH